MDIKKAETNYKLVSLIAADRVLYPQAYKTIAKSGSWSLAEVVQRNEGLIRSFFDFLADISDNAEYFSETAALIKDSTSSISPGQLLHVPGQAFEALISLNYSNSKNTVKKNTGAYYTPQYIVKHMVSRCAAKIAGKSENKTITKGFNVIDPACGGASFLIELFECLIGYGYPPEQALEAVYGTDINPDAVKLCIFIMTVLYVSKLSEYKHRNVSDFAEAKKMSEKNIKAVNTLTADWESLYPNLFNPNTPADIRGFNLVIGNPPYVSNKLIPPDEKEHYREKYRSASGQFDLSVPFIEEGVKLLGNEGILSYITSNKFLAAEYGRNLRQLLLEDYHLTEIIDISTLNDFGGTAAYPVILTISNSRKKPISENFLNIIKLSDWNKVNSCEPIIVRQDFFRKREEHILTTELTEETLPLIAKLDSVKGRISRKRILCGLAVAGFGKWVIEEVPTEIQESPQSPYLPFVQAGDIKPYHVKPGAWINSNKIKYANMGKIKIPKLVIPGIALKLTAAVDYSGSMLGRVYYITNEDLFNDLRYLAVLFNSYLLNFFYRIVYWPVHLANNYLRFNSGYISGIPVQDMTGVPRDLVHDIIKTGEVLETRGNGTKEWKDAKTRAEALVFKLYCFNTAQAKTVMDFMQTPAMEIESIIAYMKRNDQD
ncbi:Eco57I restriction-modification methylase domain-containing protein [Phosphitispora sp. TUW77]|uniref:Eco57I restriction-modification methylase domain-containing protein n=1 Tax=Phosphitispora sp. TUW77 TaxID=3152361 RepID=UPI003AB43AA2